MQNKVGSLISWCLMIILLAWCVRLSGILLRGVELPSSGDGANGKHGSNLRTGYQG